MEQSISPEGYGEQTTKEIVDSVARKISTLLSEKRRQELSEELLLKATSLVESVDHSSKSSPAERLEQILLTFALASKNAGINSSKSRVEESQIMDLIFGNESSSLIDTGVIGLYLAKSFPEIWEGVGIRNENPEKYFASLNSDQRDQIESDIFRWAKDNIAKGGQVLRIGHSHSQSLKLQEDVFRTLNIPKTRQTAFGAITIKEYNFILLMHDDPTGQDELHEKNHLNPGLMVGYLGYALDEGMTEHLAIVEGARQHQGTTWHGIWTDRQKDLFDVAGKYKAYLDERRLVAKMTDNGKNSLYDLFIERYKSGSESSSLELAAQLINLYGYKKYLQIYLASPDVPLANKGVLQSSVKVTNSLK